MGKMKIKSLMLLTGSAICISMIATVGVSQFVEGRMKVRGPVYNQIVQGKDLIADVLPPPAYLVESYLEASLVVLDPSSVGARRTRLAELKRQFEERHAYWQEQKLQAEISDLIVKRSYAPGQKFWAIVDGELLPAAEKRDAEALQAAFTALTDAYTAHRAEIDALVAKTNAENSRVEASASNTAALLEGLAWLFALAAFGVTCVGLWTLSRRIIIPVVETTAVMNQLVVGDLEVSVRGADRQDELGDMARSVEIFRNNLAERARLAREAGEKAEKERARQQKVEKLIDQFRLDITRFLQTALEQVASTRSTAEALGKSATGAVERAGSAAQTTVAMSSEMESISAAAEELSVSIRELSDQSERARAQAELSRAVSARGGAEMQALNEHAQKISAIAEIIRGIAAQTNLLALNATIEAARAGEAGRGFAVVAGEVKNLAEQTAKSTGEIEAIISSMQRSVDGVGGAFGESQATLGQIEAIVSTIASAVTEQNAATGEISSTITRTAMRAQENASDMEQLVQAANFTKGATQTMAEVSDRIAESTKALEAVIDSFLCCVSDDLDERRASNRSLSNEAVVVFSSGRRVKATLKDVSDSGARATVKAAIHVGEEAALEWASGRVEACKVVWVRGEEAGFAFTRAARAAA